MAATHENGLRHMHVNVEGSPLANKQAIVHARDEILEAAACGVKLTCSSPSHQPEAFLLRMRMS